MSLNDSGLFESLRPAPKAAESKAAPGGWSLGGRPAARAEGPAQRPADFAGFLKAEAQAGRAASGAPVLAEGLEFQLESTEGLRPEYLFEPARESAPRPEIDEGGRFAALEEAPSEDFSLLEPQEEIAASAEMGESTEFAEYMLEAAKEAATAEAGPGEDGRSDMGGEADSRGRANGLLKAEPLVQARAERGPVDAEKIKAPSPAARPESFLNDSPRAQGGPAMTSLPAGPEKYKVPTAPSAVGDEDGSETSPRWSGGPEGFLKASPRAQGGPALTSLVAESEKIKAPMAHQSAGGDEDGSETSPRWSGGPEGFLKASPRAQGNPVLTPADSEKIKEALAQPKASGPALTPAGSEKIKAALAPPLAKASGPALTPADSEKIKAALAQPKASGPALTPADSEKIKAALAQPRASGPALTQAGSIKIEVPTATPTAPPTASPPKASGPAMTPADSLKIEVPTAPPKASGPALTPAGSIKIEAPTAMPTAPPTAHTAPTTAPSAGGDEDDARSEALWSNGSEAFLKAAPRPQAKAGPALTPSIKIEASLTPPAAPPAAHTAPPTMAPSAGGDEDDARSEALWSNGPETFLKASPRPQAGPFLTSLAAEPEKTHLATLARSVRPGHGDWNSLTSNLLARNRLNLAAGRPAAPAWTPREGADPAAVNAALDRAKIAWPTPFRQQVGLGLVALGRPGLSSNSMSAGASLLGAASTGEVLRSVLSGFKGELKVLKLPPAAREDLGRILAGSGLDQERLGRIMSGFGRDGLSLDELNRHLAGVDLSGRGQGLTATESGLVELGQFLGSLGASTEVIGQVMHGLKPGQALTGEVLRDIFKRTEVGGLARNLGPGDLRSLSAFLRSMGAAPGDLEKLESLLSQSSGQLTLDGFLDFLDGMKEAPAVSGQELEGLKSLLEQVGREDGLARGPVFNEILVKLKAMGDAEIDDDFLNLSPALQALRGGISGADDFADGQFQGQQGRERENQERYRQAVNAAATGQDGPAGAAFMAEAGGYGGRSEPLARQIAQKIVLSRRRGLNRLKMKLNPAELGRLDIELAVKDGALTARIRAESRSAYEALGEHVAELKKALAEGGVKLAGLTLAHDDVESGQTVTFGLNEPAAENVAETRAARARADSRPGEVHRVI